MDNKDAAQLEDVIKRTTKETLIQVGFDMSDPIAMQADMHFLRSLRGLCQKAGIRAMMIAIGVATAGMMILFWRGFNSGN